MTTTITVPTKEHMAAAIITCRQTGRLNPTFEYVIAVGSELNVQSGNGYIANTLYACIADQYRQIVGER